MPPMHTVRVACSHLCVPRLCTAFALASSRYRMSRGGHPRSAPCYHAGGACEPLNLCDRRPQDQGCCSRPRRSPTIGLRCSFFARVGPLDGSNASGGPRLLAVLVKKGRRRQTFSDSHSTAGIQRNVIISIGWPPLSQSDSP